MAVEQVTTEIDELARAMARWLDAAGSSANPTARLEALDEAHRRLALYTAGTTAARQRWLPF